MLKTCLRVRLVPPLLGSNPSRHQMILDSVGQGEIVVPSRRDVPVLDEGVVEVTVEALLDVGHVLDRGNRADGDLLAPIGVGNWCGLRHLVELDLLLDVRLVFGVSVGTRIPARVSRTATVKQKRKRVSSLRPFPAADADDDAQCDQMALLLFNLGPFTTMTICPLVAQKCQSWYKSLPNT